MRSMIWKGGVSGNTSAAESLGLFFGWGTMYMVTMPCFGVLMKTSYQ